MQIRPLTQILLTFTILLLSFFLIQCKSQEKEREEILDSIVEVVNSQCPVKIDALTRLDSCQREDKNSKVIEYYYTILNESLFDVELFESLAVPTMKDRLKRNPKTEIYRKYDITLKYYFTDKNSKVLCSFRITPKDL